MAALLLTGVLSASAGAVGEAPGPFERFAGRWVGEGRLGIRDGATEQVRCRVTYSPTGNGQLLHQSIRCASPSGSIEVQTDVKHQDGRLTGKWKELTRDWGGEVSGKVTDKGLRVRVTGDAFKANMSIDLRGDKQVIDIQFIDSALIGLTLALTQG
ncbi:MAG: hypothetical protein NW223_10680 [Hyphomicrobiaceae bacterium]|nr:hypothetical protein [Hyphomicrobiaceae bacterium]